MAVLSADMSTFGEKFAMASIASGSGLMLGVATNTKCYRYSVS
jgi:hypothetical protein